MALIGNAVVGQSGGPTAAINATLAGVIEASLAHRNVIPTLYGMRNGIMGFLDENVIDLTARFENDGEGLRLLRQTPAAALGSCRLRLPEPEGNGEFYENLIALFRKYDIRYFFYIGGNDSMDTVSKLQKYLDTCDYEMRCVGVPKTIDNDLNGTDHTPGYGSAAKYIAATMQEILRDCHVYSIPAVTIVEIMGRDAGWLTAAAAIPGALSDVKTDLLYLPERAFDEKAFLEDVRAALDEEPAVVIAVSEGLKDAEGEYVCASQRGSAVDVFGHKALAGTAYYLSSLVRDRIGCKVRSIELNICQRCASHIASRTDTEESAGVGGAALEAAVAGKSGVMACIRREERDGQYAAAFGVTDVREVANTVRAVPESFINERGNGVTAACLAYMLPLVQGELDTLWRGGLPVHITL